MAAVWGAVAMALLLPAFAQAGTVKAGVAVVDASWHVGASAGQYASDGSFVNEDTGVDPTMHSTRRKSSYGMQSRLNARALVTEGSNGERVALVKYDLYIPQDLLYRRTAQILEARGTSGITRENLTLAVTHNHSSPLYSSPSWGVWAFQDVIDVRFFDYYARRMALAVERAAANMKPVRVGAKVVQFDKTHRHSFGPALGDDGTPAGYPNSDADHALTVVRYDLRNGKPLATLVNFSLHPEFLEGNDLISGDYLAPLQRMVDRRTGGVTIWTQNAVGTGEPERSSYHSIHERLEFTHKDYGQAEYGARLMADAILGAWSEIPRIRAVEPGSAVPMSGDFDVHMEDRWYPGPISHPYPGVSNCRTDRSLDGNPQVPAVGLPTCQGPRNNPVGDVFAPVEDTFGPQNPGVTTDDLQRAGIPVPENYGAPSYTGLEEDLGVHLQAFRLGDMLFTVCSCEQWKDQAENIRSRTDRQAGNEYLGYDWKQQCTQRGDGTYGLGVEGYGTGTWDCPDPRDTSRTLPPLSDQKVQRMHAQVVNPANGWNDPAYAAYAESEPTDLRQIKGNYTHDDDARSAALGYDLTVPIAMANDYNGYIATYREYQRGDEYRKALTGWGPHSSDYIATRLVWMGRAFHDGDYKVTDASDDLLAAKNKVDLAFQDRKAEALGEIGATSISAYDALLPPSGGEAGPEKQPGDIERFSATHFSWNGGDNYTDNPRVRVQRLSRRGWVTWEDQSGEVPVMVRYPRAEETPVYLAGGQKWIWTAAFEAFAAPFDTGNGTTYTPAGTFRFVARGKRREGDGVKAYRIASEPFEVRDWSGITVDDLRVEPDGTASFAVGPRRTFDVNGLSATVGPIDYPDSYKSPFRFVVEKRTPYVDPAAPGDPSQIEWFCFTCSFRPWIDAGDAESAYFLIAGRRVPAVERDGRWYSSRALEPGQSASVPAGAVVDAYGNHNGRASAPVTR